MVALAIREIDDSAPEFAPLWEPVGKEKHRKGLCWGLFSGFAMILAAALFVPAIIPEIIPEPEPEPPVAAST